MSLDFQAGAGGKTGGLVSGGLRQKSHNFYEILPNERGITCLVCGHTSHNPEDVQRRYCPRCQMFHEDRSVISRLNEGFETEFHSCAAQASRFSQAA